LNDEIIASSLAGIGLTDVAVAVLLSASTSIAVARGSWRDQTLAALSFRPPTSCARRTSKAKRRQGSMRNFPTGRSRSPTVLIDPIATWDAASKKYSRRRRPVLDACQ
jgi:hypothetical protein